MWTRRVTISRPSNYEFAALPLSYKSISFNLTIKSDIVSFNDNTGTGGEIGYSHAVLFGYCTTSNQARLMVVLPILSATPAYKF